MRKCSHKAFCLLLFKKFCLIRKTYMLIIEISIVGGLGIIRKVVQFTDLQDEEVKPAAVVMEIAVVIIKKTLAYSVKLSSRIGSIFTALFPGYFSSVLMCGDKNTLSVFTFGSRIPAHSF